MNTTIADDRQPTVLLVEDDPMIAEMMGEVLRSAGYDVIVVAAAEDALGLAVMDVAVDAVVTDINLAGPLDGWELAEALREMQPGIPVIYASANASGESLARGVEASVFVPKPYSPYTVCALVDRFVGRPPARRSVESAPASVVEVPRAIIRLSA